MTLSFEQRRRRIEARQDRCDHFWHHEFATINNRLIASTWCGKCMISMHAYEQQVSRGHKPQRSCHATDPMFSKE